MRFWFTRPRLDRGPMLSQRLETAGWNPATTTGYAPRPPLGTDKSNANATVRCQRALRKAKYARVNIASAKGMRTLRRNDQVCSFASCTISYGPTEQADRWGRALLLMSNTFQFGFRINRFTEYHPRTSLNRHLKQLRRRITVSMYQMPFTNVEFRLTAMVCIVGRR